MSDSGLLEAVKSGHMAGIKEMLKSGVDVNQQDEQGWTPLNWAAGRGDVKTVELLLEQGADVLKVGRDQRTPYMIALAAGHIEVVKLLNKAQQKLGQGESGRRRKRKYCQAYPLKRLRQFPGWTEGGINRKASEAHTDDDGVRGDDQPFSDDDIVYLHQDFTVTQSMWHNEDVIFNQVTPAWSEFCSQVLEFEVPDDLDLTVSAGDDGDTESSESMDDQAV